MVQMLVVVALLGGCGCGDSGPSYPTMFSGCRSCGGSGSMSGCSSCGSVSTVAGCSSCGEVTSSGCGSCGSKIYTTGYCGSCERYNEGVPVLANPEYQYQGYSELKSFSSCTAKLQCGRSYCYTKIPIVNGCLPKLHISRREDGCLTQFRCDYSAKVPYRGGVPTYGRKKAVELPSAAPTTVPAPIPEPTPATPELDATTTFSAPPTTVPLPKE